MSHTDFTELSDSNDCEKFVNQYLQTFPLRRAEIGQGTVIKRALPSRHKRMIGAWCFLDHAGPAHFAQGEGLDVGPHPHIGLQTFTWMIEGSMMHGDSLGTQQLIRPKQVNLMTAGYGITHTEVAPETETQMHSVQLWIALPDAQKDMPPQFDHYPELPVVEKDQLKWTILVGEFLATASPVHVHSALLGVDIESQQAASSQLKLDPTFEYGFLLLEGSATVNGHELTQDNMIVLDVGVPQVNLSVGSNSRIILVGGEPFESPILLWWNFVGRTQEELAIAREQWVNQDTTRYGQMNNYDGARLIAPTFPDRMRASK